jgi:hypothetical protein
MSITPVTQQQVGQIFDLPNPNTAQSTDLKNITGDLNTGNSGKLQGDVAQLLKDDPQLQMTGSGGVNQNGSPSTSGGSNNDAMIQMLISLLMQLMQGNGNGNSNGQQQTGQQPPATA